MIIGHIGLGLLTQYFALRQRNSNPKVQSSIPAWCTVVGATLSDVITGTLVILGVEQIRSNASIKPLGLTLVNIDWSHSLFMTIVSGAIWATYCSYSVRSSKYIWGWSFASVLTHFLGDLVVHNHDLAIFPNPTDGVKYGIGLWANIPKTVWFGELLVIGIGAGVTSTLYGIRKLRSLTILMVALHSMNFPGVFTNLPYTFGQIYRNNPNLLRLSIGITLIAFYLLPAFYTSYVLDRRAE